MGSSAMGASVLRKKIQAAGHGDVTVVNKAISNLDDDYDLVVTHQDLTDRARQRTPSAIHVSVDNFMGSPRYDEIVELIDQSNAAGGAAAPGRGGRPSPPGGVLGRGSIVLGGTARYRDAAITEAGRAAGRRRRRRRVVRRRDARAGAVGVHRMGNSLAIPHGTNEAKWRSTAPAISFVRYDEPIDWNGKPAEFVLGIAGAGDDHLALLSRIAETSSPTAQVVRPRSAGYAPDDVLAVLDVVRV